MARTSSSTGTHLLADVLVVSDACGFHLVMISLGTVWKRFVRFWQNRNAKKSLLTVYRLSRWQSCWTLTKRYTAHSHVGYTSSYHDLTLCITKNICKIRIFGLNHCIIMHCIIINPVKTTGICMAPTFAYVAHHYSAVSNDGTLDRKPSFPVSFIQSLMH